MGYSGSGTRTMHFPSTAAPIGPESIAPAPSPALALRGVEA